MQYFSTKFVHNLRLLIFNGDTTITCKSGILSRKGGVRFDVAKAVASYIESNRFVFIV